MRNGVGYVSYYTTKFVYVLSGFLPVGSNSDNEKGFGGLNFVGSVDK